MTQGTEFMTFRRITNGLVHQMVCSFVNMESSCWFLAPALWYGLKKFTDFKLALSGRQRFLKQITNITLTGKD